MSLLDTASLIVTPNAYKEGKLYSVIPSDGSGDLTFTRATTATRVNSAGLVELVPYNLLTYSEQFDNAAWVKQNGTITPNTIASPSGVSSADTFTDNSTNSLHGIVRFSQWSTTQQTFSIYVKPNTLTKFFIANGSTGNAVCFDLTTLTVEGYTNGSGNLMINPTITPMINGWIRLSATHTATASQTLSFGFYKVFNATSLGATVNYIGSGETAYLWGAQLVEGSVAKDYQKTETRLNIPRLDYSLGGCPNILLEPQRTNLVTYSEQFDDASWNKINSSVTANADISPDGYTNADRIYDNATSGQHRVGKNISVVSATTYTFSVFAKKGSLRYCYLFTVAGGASDRYYFDLQDGVSITAGGKIEDYGSGWYRISAQVTAAATGNELFAFNLTNSSSSPTYSGTGTGYHMIYGYQVEAGDYATSYIPTTTASVTRNFDIPSLTNIYTSGKLSASGGTWFTHLVNNVPRTRDSGGGVGLRLSNVAANNVFHISTPSGSNQRYWIRKIVGGANTDLYSTLTDEIKVAIKWNGSTADVFVNGVKVVAATAFTSVDLENLNVNNGNIPYYISSMLLAPTPLTDDQLATLTTI
jgi:hypothetical protein